MRVVVAALAAFVIGFVVGGYAPRSRLQKAEADLAQARDELSRVGRDSSALAAVGLGQLLAAQRGSPPPPVAAPPPSVAAVPQPPQPSPPSPPSIDEEPAEERDSPDAGTPRERFTVMRDAALLRSAQYRSRYLEEAQLDPAGVGKLDEVVRDLNADLRREAERVARSLEGTSGPPRPRQMVDAVIPLLQAYQRADDRFAQVTPPEARAAADRTNFDLFTQVDPGAFEPLIDVMARRESAAAPRNEQR